MQISKTFLTCGVALCLVAVSARAGDTAADAQLREALRQKIAELAPPEAAPAAPTTPVTPAPVAPAAVAPPPIAPAPVTPPPVVEPVVIAPAVVAPEPVPVAVEPVPVAAALAAPTVEDDAQTARLREALRASIAEENARAAEAAPVIVTQGSDLAPAVSTTTVISPQTGEPTKASVTAAPAPVPMVAPPLPISGSKAERLAQLLQQYKVDQISPEQYHQQRAKILAE